MAMNTDIALICHQIWMQGEDKIPEKYKAHRQSWKDNHPNVKFMLWDEDSIFKLIKEFYPLLIPVWESQRIMVVRVDVGKVVILYHYGGFYADMDMACLKNVAPLLQGWNLVFARTYDSISKYFAKLVGVPFYGKLLLNNAFLGASQKHPVYKMAMEEIANVSTKIKESKYLYGVYVANYAGPELLCKVLYRYLVQNNCLNDPKQCKVMMYSNEYFEPKLKKMLRKTDKRRKEDYAITNNTHAVHFFAKSWLQENPWSFGEIGVGVIGIISAVVLAIVIVIVSVIATILKQKKAIKQAQLKKYLHK